MKKSLQALGALALIAWTVTGLFAWSRVGEGVQLTVMEGEQAAASDDFALLDDRLDALSSDLDALVASLEGNFNLLADAVQQSGTSTEQERARIEQRLSALEAALPHALESQQTAEELASLVARLESLALVQAGRTEGLAEAPEGIAAQTTPQADGQTPEPIIAQAEPEPVAPTPEPVAREVAAATDEPPAKRSFLSFKLPSRDFQFEGRQTFEVLADLSRVGFDAKSTLHDFSGVSNRVQGQFTMDLTRPADGIEGHVEILSHSLSTDLEGRDEAMYEHLDSERFEHIRFEPSAFEAGSLDKHGKRTSGRLTGQMSIRGVTLEVAMDVTAHVDDSRRLVVEGEMPLLLTDYGVKIPHKLGMIKVDHNVRVWIHLRLRARAGSTAQ